MNTDIFDKISEILLRHEGQGSHLACTKEEIAGLESKFEVQLPDVYKLFLAKIGKYKGGWFYSDDYQIGYDDFEWNHRHFEERFRHFGLEIYKDVIALGSCYCDTVWFIKTTDQASDPVLFYIRDDGELKLNESGCSFIGFFEQELQSCLPQK